MFVTPVPDLSTFARTANVPQFVSPDILTVAEVLAQFPAAPAHRGKYVRVSDLFGAIDGVMRCGSVPATGRHFWQPTTPEYSATMSTAQNMSLAPLTSPTIVTLTGNILLGITRNVTLETINGRPGEIKEIKAAMTSILGGLNILGTGLGSGVALLAGGFQKYALEDQAGTLTWVRLV